MFIARISTSTLKTPNNHLTINAWTSVSELHRCCGDPILPLFLFLSTAFKLAHTRSDLAWIFVAPYHHVQNDKYRRVCGKERPPPTLACACWINEHQGEETFVVGACAEGDSGKMCTTVCKTVILHNENTDSLFCTSRRSPIMLKRMDSSDVATVFCTI